MTNFIFIIVIILIFFTNPNITTERKYSNGLFNYSLLSASLFFFFLFFFVGISCFLFSTIFLCSFRVSCVFESCIMFPILSSAVSLIVYSQVRNRAIVGIPGLRHQIVFCCIAVIQLYVYIYTRKHNQ